MHGNLTELSSGGPDSDEGAWIQYGRSSVLGVPIVSHVRHPGIGTNISSDTTKVK